MTTMVGKLLSAGTSASSQDRAGIALSILCLVHCSIGVVGAMLLPFFGHQEHSHSHLHLWFAAGVILLSVLAFGRGFSRHRRFEVLLGALVGVGLISTGLYFEEESTWLGTGLTMVGSVLLIATHLRNISKSSCKKSCCASSH